MAVDKITGFAAPYRSLTFRKFLDEVVSRNGIMSMSGEVSEALGIVTIPPFTFNQQGLIVNVSSQKTVTKPSGLTGSYLLIVSAPTNANTDDLVYTFVESPLEVGDNEVVIAEWDGNEWRQQPFLSVDELIKASEQEHLDFAWDGPINGLITSVDGLSYRNTAGLIVDRQGRKVRVDDDQLFPIIDDDPEATWSRVDRMVWRRQTDNVERVGVRQLLLGGTYSAGTQLVSGPTILNTDVHSRVRVGLYGNEAVVLSTKGFGASFSLWLTRVQDDRSAVSMAATQIAGVTAHTDEVDLFVDPDTGDCYVVYVNNGDIYLVHTDSGANIVDGPVQINTQAQPCSSPRIVRDRAGKFLITFLALMGPSNNQVFFASCDDAGATITGAKRVTNTATNHIHQDMVVTPDYKVYLAYEDETQGKIYYDILNDIGDVETVAPVYVSANVVSNSYGTNSDAASLPKIRVSDTRDLFIFFLQDIGGDKKLAIVKNDSAGYLPDLLSPADDLNDYDVKVSDWMNDIWVAISDVTGTFRMIVAGEGDIAQVAVLSAESISLTAQSIAMLQDETGSLFVAQSNALPGTYSDVGTPETVQHIGAASVVGTLATVNLASNQFALLTAGLSQTPVIGQQVTIAGAADPLNDGAKIVSAVELADYDSPGDYTVITLETSFNSTESPAAAVTAQFAEPDGMDVDVFKVTAELQSRALRQDVLDSDVLLARIIVPGPTILNYVQNPVFSGGTTAMSIQFGVYGSSQIDWEDTNPGEFTIQTSFGIVDMFNALDYTILAGSHAMAEGDALYVKLDGVNFAVSPQVTQINTLPWSEPIQVLGFIKNGNFVPALLALGGGDEMVPGEIIVIGEDLPAPLRSRLGLLTDTTYEDYTNTHRVQLSDNYPQAISRLDIAAEDHDQDRNTKLVEGGTWLWDGTDLSWDDDAYIQTPDCADTRNTILAGSIALAANEVAYVDINRDAGAPANLTVNVANINALTKGADRFVIARRVSDGVIVGTHSFKLIAGESRSLDAGPSNETMSALGLPDEADEGQLRIMAIVGSKRIRITPTDKLVFDGTTWGNEISGLAMKFDGFQIDLETGNYYEYGDGTVAGSGPLIGSAFTPSTFTNPNVFRWYSINLVANTVDVDGRMTVRPLILAGTPDAALANSAIKAVYSSKKLGQVLVEATGTGSTLNTLVQDRIIQLSAGAGGGSGAAPKMIGGGVVQNDVTETPLAVQQNIGGSASTSLAITANEFLGQTFQFGSDRFLKDVTMRMSCPAGTPSGLVRAEVYEVASLAPSGSFAGKLVGVSDTFDTAVLTASFVDQLFTFNVPVFVRASKFYIVVLKNTEILGAALLVRRDSANPISGAMVSGNTGTTITTIPGSDLYFIINASTYSCAVSYDRPFYVEQPRLNYEDNTVPVSEGPWVLPTVDHVAYVERLNASSGGSDLAVLIDLITNVKDGQLVLARRDGNTVVIGTSSTRLRPGQKARVFASESNFTNQDRNGKLVEGGTWSVEASGTDLLLNWDQTAYIDIPGLNKTSNLIPAPSSPLALAEDQIAFVNLDRIGKPAAPTYTEVGSEPVGGVSAGGAYLNGYLYSTDNSNNLYVTDVSDPTNPTLVSTTPLPGGNSAIFSSPNSLVIDGANSILYQAATNAGARVILAWDISTPAAPSYLSSTTGVGGGSSGYRFVLSEDSQYLFLSVGALVYSFDVSNPASLGASLGSVNIGAVGGSGFMSVKGNVLYATDLSALVFSIDISTPASMAILDSIASPGVVDVSITIGNVLFAMGATALYSIDITDPNNLAAIGTSTSYLTTAIHMYKDHRGDFIHIGHAVSNPTVINTFDVSDPANMVEVGSTNLSQTTAYGTFANGYLYIVVTALVLVVEIDIYTPIEVHVRNIADVDQNNDDLAVIARRIGDTVYVGSKSMALAAGQYAELDGAIPEIYRRLSQLAMTPHPSDGNRVVVKGADTSMLDQSTLSLTIKKLLMAFDGAQIDFSTGDVYEADGVTPLGINFTPFSIPANQYFFYSVTVVPSTVNANNTINVQLLVLPASGAAASLAAAPRPVFPSTGTPMGYVWVREDGGGIEPISYANIGRFGPGTGSGSDVDEGVYFLEDLKRRLEDDGNRLQWLTPVIIALHEDDRLDGASTGSYDVANNEYDLEAAQEFLSIQQYGAQFLAAEQDNLHTELQVLWSNVDDAATYEVAKDGTTFEPITMERVGETGKFRGVLVFSEPPGSAQYQYPVSNESATAELNTSTRQSYAIPLTELSLGVKKKMLTGNIYVSKTGSPTGELRIKLVKETAGVPGTTVVGQNKAVIDIGSLSAGNNTIAIDIPAIFVEGRYWLVIETSPVYKSVFSAGVTSLSVRTDNTSPSYVEGDSYQYNGTVWSAHAGNHAVFQLFGYTYDLRVKVTASQASSIKGTGIFYGEQNPLAFESHQAIQRFDIDGDDDETELLVTKFIPDPMACKVYIVNTGQVLRYPAFNVDGRTLVFSAGQFLLPGETIIVLVDQSEATVFDNSDMNANLLATNRFGSTDPTMDRSVAGEGHMHRADNGIMVEASIRWNGAAYEWVFAEVPGA